MLKKICFFLLIIVVLLINGLRCWKLDAVPEGYHINELASAVTVQCFVESGCDGELRPWPLFGAMQYGQDKPPTYIYPGMIWAKIFGASVPSLRGLSTIIFLIGVLGLFFLSRELFSTSVGLMAILAATCSPWSWMINRMALESFSAPVFVIWGLYFFARSGKWLDWMTAAILFAAAMYAYPPARLQVPLMLITLGVLERRRLILNLQSSVILLTVFAVTLLPMVLMYAQGLLSRRFDAISIFNKDYLYVIGKSSPWDMMMIFFHNYTLHLTADFLFFTGDPSYLYSTRHLGLLSWLDIGALIILIACSIMAMRRPDAANPALKYRRWIIWFIVNFLIGIIPSALTNQELPNAMRMCGSWPWMMLTTALIWGTLAESMAAWWLAAVLTGALCAAVLMYQYFGSYPAESRITFGYAVKELAGKIHTPQEWKEFVLAFSKQQYHCRYFLSHELGMTCKQARSIWQQADQAAQGLPSQF